MGKRVYIYIERARTRIYGDLWKRGPFKYFVFYDIFLYFIILPCFELLLISSIFVFNICLQALLNKTSICKKSHFFQRGRGMSCLSRVFRQKGFSGLPKS